MTLMSHFSPNSAFTTGDLPPTPRVEPHIARQTQEISNKTLEDWAHQVEQFAYEAEDEQLLPLYSSLLDLRDEIVHLLHQNA